MTIESGGGISHEFLEAAKERARDGSAWDFGTRSIYAWNGRFLVVNGVWQGVSMRPVLLAQFKAGREVAI